MAADDCTTPDDFQVKMPREPEPELDAHQKVRMECLRLAVMRTDNANALKAIDLAKEYESYVNCGYGLSEMTLQQDVADMWIPNSGSFEPFTPPAPPSQSPT